MSFERLKKVSALSAAGLTLAACGAKAPSEQTPQVIVDFCNTEVTGLYQADIAAVPANDTTTEVDEAYAGTAKVQEQWTTEAVSGHLETCYNLNYATEVDFGILAVPQEFVDAQAATLHSSLITPSSPAPTLSPSASASAS